VKRTNEQIQHDIEAQIRRAEMSPQLKKQRRELLRAMNGAWDLVLKPQSELPRAATRANVLK